MRINTKQSANLTFVQKVSRLRERMRDPEWRKYALLVALGKFCGLMLMMAIVYAIFNLSHRSNANRIETSNDPKVEIPIKDRGEAAGIPR